MKTFINTTLLVSSFLFSFHSFSAVIYVNINATGSNNGTSWANAYTNLQSALSVAFINDEIWVATGIYKPTSTTNREISFVMKNGVNVYGGFDGTETNINQRDILANPTTLSGDIGALGDNTDNTKKVVKAQNFTTNFIMDGFRITSGYDSGSTGRGAGMYLINNLGAQITINNCIFYDNYGYDRGGGLYVDDTNITFNNCEFLYNTSYDYGGGAIYSANVSNSNIALYDCKFIGNVTRDGAAIKFGGISLLFERCLISNNTSNQGGDIISIDSGVSSFAVNNSLIVGNLITQAAGSLISIYASAPAMSITNSTICHNRNSSAQVPYYEMIYKANGPLNIYNSIVFGNTNSDQNVQIDSGNNVVNSIVENGYSTGTNVITLSPVFSSPGTLATAPFNASTYDYSLVENSPGINAGNNSFSTQFMYDYEQNTRIQQFNVDCGAIESPYSDTQAPTAICQDVTIFLNNLGTAIIDSSMIDYGSSDNIGIETYTLSASTFNCANIGTNSVSLTVLDANGNSDMCLSTVTVLDNLGPIVVGQNLSIDLDATGNASIDAAQIENGSSDNCGIQSISIDPSTFTCSNVGNNNVTLTVEDVNGNTSSAVYVVTVNDTVNPVAIAQDVTLYLNSSGNVNLVASSVNNGSTDDCSIASYSVSTSSFSCNYIGTFPAIFTATDYSGNSSTDEFTVTILDTISPVAVGTNIQVNLANSNPYVITSQDINTGSYDNCFYTLSIEPNSFNEVGIYDVNLTITDGSGNSDTKTYQVEVINSAVGLNEFITESLELFPNPFNTAFTLQLAAHSDFSISIINADGKVIKSIDVFLQENSAVSISVDDLASGIYYVRVLDSQNNVRYAKIIKTND